VRVHMGGTEGLMTTRILGLTLVLLGGLLRAQGPPGGASPFLGSVPQGKATGEELPLTLSDAIESGLKYNLGTLLSSQGVRAARGAHVVALGKLMPNLSAGATESAQQINLAGFGFPGLPGIAPIVGPFGISDARAYLSQPILNFRSIRDNRAAGQEEKASSYSNLDARDTVVLVVTALYLQAVTGASRVEAAQAQATTAEAFYNQAADFKQAGVVPAIDVLRAQVELRARQQRLIFARNELEKQKLSLARAIGLPDGQRIRLTDNVPFVAAPPMTVDEALGRAYTSRMDYQSASALLRAAELKRDAARAGRLPSLAFDGNYGTLGPSLANSHGTFTAAVSLNIPLFQGGRVSGDVLQADAALEQQRARLEDLRGAIAYQVRTAFLDMTAAGDEVGVARSAVDLAQQQLTQARDRFAAGVTGNLEVVQAQEAVATANEDYISSLYAYNAAKASLARAIGGAEKLIPAFLQGGSK
jgi:outer membrane protein TolC